jgi:AraC-like DNA-binding protein
MVFDKDILALYLDLHLTLETRGSRLAGELLLLELMARLVTRYAQEPASTKASGQERQPISRVRDYLTESYAENVRLDQLAQIAGLSAFHLSRVFCREVGMPPHAFQTQVRIARAKTLIRQGHPISHVAMLTGFADQSHFTRHFKRLVQLTPGQYLQDSKNVQDRSDPA